MNKIRIAMKRIGILAVLVALLLIIPQPVAAQLPVCTQGTSKPTLTIPGDTPPARAIAPISGREQFSVQYNYAITQAIFSIEAVVLTFSVSNVPSWATVTPQSQQVAVTFDQPGSASGEASGKVDFVVTVEANAPAFVRQSITVTANASPGTCVEAPDTATRTVDIQPGFYELWQARFGQAIHKYGQNTNFQIPLVIENAGNGRVEVTLSHLRDENGNGRGMDVVVPGGRHMVGSEAQGQAERSTTLNIDVQTPFKNGYMNERIPLVVEITGRSADQHDIELTPAQLRATITTQGVYVPGFEMVFALVAMLGVAMLQMRRRS